MKSKKFYAIKIYNKIKLKQLRVGMKKGVFYEKVMEEIRILKVLRHRNIVLLFEIINDPRSNHLYLVTEYLDGGALSNESMYTETQARSVFLDIANALQYIHASGVIHRDIKPENLLFSASHNTAKIGDFGSAEMFIEDDIITSTAGTPAYFAPELCVKYDVENPPRGRPCDVWALGMSLYNIVFGKHPFMGKTIMETYERIRKTRLTFPKEVRISEDLKDLLKKMLRKNPKKRISIAEILEHNWCSNPLKDASVSVSSSKKSLPFVPRNERL